MDGFEFRGNLDPVTVRVVHECKKVVTRAVPAGSPYQRYVLIGEVVAPVADIIPFPGLITMMVNTLLVRQEAGQSVMFVVAGILVLYLLLGCLMDSLA